MQHRATFPQKRRSDLNEPSSGVSGPPSDGAFIHVADVPAISRSADHGGNGVISFRRLLSEEAFASAIDFVDLSIVPSGCTIGQHSHHDSEELYFIASGTPLVTIDGQSRRLTRGDLSVVRSGQWHELINDTSEPVEIFVVQVHL
jgi:mannose-6-phosphate isomerase-like protein (cupin superfamily)